jgi:hypothetical protein
VLRPGGRLVAIAIEPASDLSAEERERAVEIGPSHVAHDDSLVRFAEAVGFRLLSVEDVTLDFRRVAEEASVALRANREGLTAEEDEQAYNEELDRKTRMKQGVDEGLLVRTLVFAERP